MFVKVYKIKKQEFKLLFFGEPEQIRFFYYAFKVF